MDGRGSTGQPRGQGGGRRFTTIQLNSRIFSRTHSVKGAHPREVILDTVPTVKIARDYQRKAQYLADFIEAENSMGFHADQEAARVLGRSIDYSRRGQMALRGEQPPPVTIPSKAAGVKDTSAARR